MNISRQIRRELFRLRKQNKIRREFLEAKKYAKAISPVPGGVGPMTVTCLLKNTLKAAYNTCGYIPKI